MRSTAYFLVSASTEPDLTALVNAAIGQGWQPHGSLVLKHDPGEYTTRYLQPMVKYEPTTESA